LLASKKIRKCGPNVQKEVQNMAKVTGKYETLFIVNPTLTEEEVAAVADKFKTLVEKNATVDKVEDWGKRRLAYAINDLREGYYTLIEFTSDPSFPAELDRIYKITDGIMRSIIVSRD
jgi:small subunit ribosomal protein S6